MKSKTEKLRLDILHNAPLESDNYEKVSFSDIESLKFITFDGGFMEVLDYKVGHDKNLVIILK